MFSCLFKRYKFQSVKTTRCHFKLQEVEDYRNFGPPDNQRSNLVWDFGCYRYLAQIVW